MTTGGAGFPGSPPPPALSGGRGPGAARRLRRVAALASYTETWPGVDSQEQLVGLLMTQFMVGFDRPQNDLRALVYQAIEE
jgi:hypothetical protein